MKIAVSSSGNSLEAPLDPHFGRCSYFVIVDPDDMSYEAFDNESGRLGGGAGIQASQFVASQGAEAVLTGSCGPNAMQTLSAAGIKVYAGLSGTVRQAVEKYKSGQLQPETEATGPAHAGMGRVGGGGAGRGMGRGAGMGRGGGMGGGRRSGR